MRVVRCVLGFLALFAVAAAQAQSYPSKPVKLIVPFPPGGSTDLVARSITPTLGDFLGQQVVIEYKGGAAGSIGTAEVARATPDGYTLLIVWDTHGVNHHLYNVQYDFFKSFDPITQLVQSPGILVARTTFPASTFKDFLDYLRANPSKVSVGMVGAGSSGNLAAVLLSQLTNTQVTFVNYKGGGPLTNDILGGHVDVVFGTYALWEPHVRSGKLKPLAARQVAYGAVSRPAGRERIRSRHGVAHLVRAARTGRAAERGAGEDPPRNRAHAERSES